MKTEESFVCMIQFSLSFAREKALPTTLKWPKGVKP